MKEKCYREMLKNDETTVMRPLNRAIQWLKNFLQTTSFDYCVIWKLGDDPSRFIEWMDCCCGAGYGHVNVAEEKKISSFCRDGHFMHFGKSKTCESLVCFPSSLSLYSGIHGEVVMANQPKWFQEGNGKRVLIPIIGGLIELYFEFNVPQNYNMVETITAQCNCFLEQEFISAIQNCDTYLNEDLHIQILPEVTLLGSNPSLAGSSIGSTTPSSKTSTIESGSVQLSPPISSNQKDNEKIIVSSSRENYQSKNLLLERNRRNRIRDGLFALRALVPNISKMDRASIIGDAIDYIHELKKNAKELQDELNDESYNIDTEQKGAQEVRKDSLKADDHGLVSSKVGENKKMKLQVEVNQIGTRGFWVKLVYEHEQGRFTRLIEAMNSIGLQVIDANVTTSNGKVMNAFKVQADKEIQLKKLKDALIKLMG